MPSRCCVPQCTETYKGLKLHKFPDHDPKLRKKWIDVIKPQKTIKDTARICSRHFTDDDYVLNPIGDDKILKETAIPSLNLPVKSTNKTKGLSRNSKNTDYALNSGITANKAADKELKSTDTSLETESMMGLGPMRSDCIACGLRNIPHKIALTGVTFHRFPKEPSLRDAWLIACGRPNWVPSPWSFLCSLHFTEDDFIYGTSDSVAQQLRENAVPTIFKTTPYRVQRGRVPKRKPPEEKDIEVIVIGAPAKKKRDEQKVEPSDSQVCPANSKKINFDDDKAELLEVDVSPFSLNGEVPTSAASEIPSTSERESEYLLPHGNNNNGAGLKQETGEPQAITTRETLLINENLRLRKENAALSNEAWTLKNALNSLRVDNLLDRERSRKTIAELRKALAEASKKVNEDGG